MTDDQAVGGARRDRTADPLLAKQMLSQLSYGPKLDLLPQGKISSFVLFSLLRLTWAISAVFFAYQGG